MLPSLCCERVCRMCHYNRQQQKLHIMLTMTIAIVVLAADFNDLCYLQPNLFKLAIKIRTININGLNKKLNLKQAAR